MCVTETNVCNFVVWIPHEILIFGNQRIQRVPDKFYTNLVKNWVDYILPELVTRNLEKNSKQLLVKTLQSDTNKYCIFCKATVAEGEI